MINQTVADTFGGAVGRMLSFIPTFLFAALLLGAGIVLARLVGKGVERLGQKAGLDRFSAQTALQRYLNRMGSAVTPSRVLGRVVMWFGVLVALQAAVGALGLPELSALLARLVNFVPSIVVALAIFAGGMLGSRFLGGTTRGMAESLHIKAPEQIGRLVEGVVLLLAAFAALSQVGVAPVIVHTLFIGLVGALSLGLGLAFGLGGRGVAGEVVRRWFEQEHRILTTEETVVHRATSSESSAH